MNAPIRVDVWSDIACPWCYIGKRRLEQALADFPGSVQIEYHSFELAPDTPSNYQGSQAQLLADYKGIPVQKAREMLEQVSQVAATAGLTFDYESLRPANTLLTHQALHYAKARGLQGALKERLLEAYFAQGRDLNKAEVIAELGAEIGLDAEDLLATLRSGTHLDAVRADHAQALGYGITGVPFYVFNSKLAVSGAQSPEVFADVLKQTVSLGPQTA